MELALTDFENAAHTVFVLLVARAVVALGLDFYMPISKVRTHTHTHTRTHTHTHARTHTHTHTHR